MYNLLSWIERFEDKKISV